MRKVLLVVFIISQLYFNLFSQIAKLDVSKKKSVSIQLATSLGSIDIPDGYYGSVDSLYFVFETKGDWEFSKGDRKDMKDVRIRQSGVNVPATAVLGIYEGKSVKKLKATYQKNIDITKEFEFFYKGYSSDIFYIKEQYWPYYPEFDRYIKKGKQLKNEGKYVEAFKALENILPGSEHNIEYSRFSTYDRAYSELIPDVVKGYQGAQETEFQTLQTMLDNTDAVTSDDLSHIQMNMDSLIVIKQLFDPFYIINEPTNNDLSAKHSKLVNDYKELYNKSYKRWETSVLKILQDGSYSKENKYEVYIGLLARVLIYTNQVERLSKLDSVNISLIRDTDNDIPFFKKYLDIMDEMGWRSEFITILEIINKQLNNNSTLLGEAHLSNLSWNKSSETQPNYYILYAFNALAKEQFGTFKDNIQNAIKKCTDKDILYYLQLWIFNERFNHDSMNDTFINAINEGLVFEKNSLPDKAIQQYKKAERLATCALPSFLIGKIKIEIQKDSISAERYFNTATSIYTNFILARIYHIEIGINSSNLDETLNEIESVLQNSAYHIWYIYFLKAKVLMLKNNLKAALNIVENNCLPLSSNNFDQYLLLGDIYFGLKDCVKATDYYQSAGDIDPDNILFSNRIRKVRSNCK